MARPRIYTKEEYKERMRERSREWNRTHKKRKRERSYDTPKEYEPSVNAGMTRIESPKINPPPAHLIEERDRRKAYIQTTTEFICGDPRPGQSALDQKRNMGTPGWK